MSAISNKHIADKLFYGIIGLLVLVLGGLGSVVIHQRMADMSRRSEKGIETTANYLEHMLPSPVLRLNAKHIRQGIEDAASEELQAVEIFDANDERVYVYERASNTITYDKKIERELISGNNHVGKMVAYFSLGSYMKEIRIREFLRLALLISAVGLVLGLGLYLLVKKIIIKPIEGTLFFSTELAAGNYDKRIDTTSNDEMGLLQKSLNKMAGALQDSIEDLKSSFYEAEGARQQAIEASRLKSEFLASMSHEIRTPLNAIIGFTELLIEDEKSEDRRDSLKTIKKSADILLENINDILDLSKIEAGKLKLTEVDFSLVELIEEITPIIKLRLHGKNVKFETNLAGGLTGQPLIGDRTRLRQILLNILINATKFTHEGRIELSAMFDKDEDMVFFKILDTGIGISKEHHEQVFDPFTQVDGSVTREYSGTGLGLAIAKRLVEMMNGRIWLESPVIPPKKGTAFYFTVELKTIT